MRAPGPSCMALDEAEAEVSEAGASPRGQLRLHCGSTFGMHQLAPAIPRFQARHPAVDIDITISDDRLGMMQEGVDLAIRIGPLEESSLVARRICNLERVICASPAYLEAHGTPRTPDDLQQHNCLWITSLPALRRWPFDTDDGIRVVHVDGNVATNNAETVLQLAMAGVGITRLADVVRRRVDPQGQPGAHPYRLAPRRAGAAVRHLSQRAQPVAQGAGDGGFPRRGIRQRTLAPGTGLTCWCLLRSRALWQKVMPVISSKLKAEPWLP